MNVNKPDEKVIEANGEEYILSRLKRHILYSIDEDKSISPTYTDEEVNSASASLTVSGLISRDDTKKRILTWKGVLVVNACRLQSRLPEAIKTPFPSPCKLCGQPTNETQAGTHGNSYAVCHDCRARFKVWKLCEFIGHDLQEIERFPYPGREHVSPGILVMKRCRRCSKCIPELDSIYD